MDTYTRRSAGRLLALLAAGMLSGCGGSSGDATPPSGEGATGSNPTTAEEAAAQKAKDDAALKAKGIGPA